MDQTDTLIDFVWRVPTAGFQWVTASSLAQNEQVQHKYLVYAASEAIQPALVYSPFVAHTGLFKRFAGLARTEKEIAEFANQFGWLGGKYTTGPLAVKGAPLRLQGEPLAGWREEIQRMKEVLAVWELANAKNLSALSTYIFWNNNAVFSRSEDGQSLYTIASEHANPDILQAFTAGDLLLPAMYTVQRQINVALAEHAASPKLLWHKGELVLRQSATSLIGAMWLQMAKAVEGNKRYNQCENCYEWMEVGGRRGARSDKRFCSPTCKAAAHRKSKQVSTKKKGKK